MRAVGLMVSLVALAGLGCGLNFGSGGDEQGAESPSEEFLAGAGLHDKVVEVDGRERSFLVYVPQAAVEVGPQPVLIVLHGGRGNKEGMRNLGFEPRADESGGVLVYPQGVNDRWTDGRAEAENEQAGIDDVGFLEHLLEVVEEHLDIDESRIGVTGPSNGGMMSYRMACQSERRLSMAAPVIASMPTDLVDDCQPEHAPSILGLQGTEDEFVTFEGGDVAHDRFPRLGEGGPIESAAQTKALWAERLGCQEADVQELERVDEEDPTWVERHVYQGCAAGQALHYYVVHGMGHAWPPMDPLVSRVSGETSPQLDATEVIWEFFWEHPLPD